MLKYLSFLLLISYISPQKEPVINQEAYKLVDDINSDEGRDIYMISEVEKPWKECLTFDKSDKSIRYLKQYKEKIGIISVYLGDDETVWVKNIPNLKTWNGKVKAKEFVSYQNLNIDNFRESHNKTGVYYFSEPLFNKERTKAIVYIWYIHSGLGISAHYHYCEKENGKWKKKNIVEQLGGFVS